MGSSAEAGSAVGTSARPPAVRALQAALVAEQAAIYGYGVVGSHLGGTRGITAAADWTAHRVTADKLIAMLRARGVTPAPAAVAYQLPHKVTTTAQALALALTLEEQVTSAYLGLVALSEESLRILGARQLRAAALRAAAWRGRTVAFPGLPASALAGPSSAARPPSAAASRKRRGRA
jgi:hypothetical protein